MKQIRSMCLASIRAWERLLGPQSPELEMMKKLKFTEDTKLLDYIELVHTVLQSRENNNTLKEEDDTSSVAASREKCNKTLIAMIDMFLRPTGLNKKKMKYYQQNIADS